MISARFIHSFLAGTLCLLFTQQAIIGQAWAQMKPPYFVHQVSTTPLASQGYIDPKLAQNLQSSIAHVYGKDKVPEVYANILHIIEKTRNARSPELEKQDLARASDWYKDEVIYMFYADQFGIKEKGAKNTFHDLMGMLPYLKNLGVTTIYILPFLDSPMGDAGFDVRDPNNVRKDLGGTEEFKEFMAAARKQGLKINADLILNHFSDQHRWFQEALKGDEEKIHYFVVSEHPPVYKRYFDPQRGVVVDYTEDDGKISSRRLVFPDYSENHYRKETINGKDYYFYHTFYPFQLDINWYNPKVLYEILNTMGYWSNLGIDIFRLDAVTFFIKEKGTDGESRPQTHDIVRILSAFVQSVAPRSVIQAEACQWPKDIVPYFGKDEIIHLHELGQDKPLRRTDEFQIAYNFPYMPAIWASMIDQNDSHFWKAFHETPDIPATASWATFLRVHDELSLEMVDIPTRKLVYDHLINKGADWQKIRVSGRMADFLDKDPARIRQAFSILLSLPGIPVIYYGDEIGALNNFEYAHEMEKEREETQKSKKMRTYFDSRDINRGPITRQAFYDALKHPKQYDGEIYAGVKNMIALRRQNPALMRGKLLEVKANNPAIFPYIREYELQKLLVVHNLSNQGVRAELTLPVRADRLLTPGGKLKTVKLKDLLTRSNVPYNIQHETSGATRLILNLAPYQSFWFYI